ncbi:MAG: 2-succinyl-5-enolpyruvyl-6-hydroxy-3-cyclohexene-1-carboxylic-acid synthase [Actinomycetota bacterium]|nr:2-succinyl-5-enolpyruvyl-6-hydroxy-3-cyclohexene-1-carboxylic-acid synthase [Actinomycetota bacterium]
MNPSTALAAVVVDELVRNGVTEAVLAPGSRSGPFAYALHDAATAGRLRLHVRIDERTAAFLALGLAKGSGVPVPVVTTSGTATANLHPAVLEASASDVPLLLLTTDRPPELRGTGANQTVDQIDLYGPAVRSFHEVGAPDRVLGDDPAPARHWRQLVCRAVADATGARTGSAGPVQLNLALRDPLVPDGDDALPAPLAGRPGGGPWTEVAARAEPVPTVEIDGLAARTIVVAGDAPPELGHRVADLAASRGWPVVAEPSSNTRHGPTALRTGDVLLGLDGLLDGTNPLAPERVLVVGRPTLTRPVQRLLATIPTDVVAPAALWPDTTRTAARVLAGLPLHASAGSDDPTWSAAWRRADDAARAELDRHLDRDRGEEPGAGAADGLRLARAFAAAVPDDGLAICGSSMPVRDLFLAADRAPAAVTLANRGAAGIDGTISTAVGAALAHQVTGGGHAVALMGDLTFLHDSNGLVIGPGEARPELTIVVVNNDGGGIFGLLEHGDPARAAAFERVFATPHGVDLAALCAATATPHQCLEPGDRDGLAAALRAPGLTVVEVRVTRSELHADSTALRRAMTTAAGAALGI